MYVCMYVFVCTSSVYIYIYIYIYILPLKPYPLPPNLLTPHLYKSSGSQVGKLVIVVSDSGAGLSEENQKRLFKEVYITINK
jgi:signal transduction histidine kinase